MQDKTIQIGFTSPTKDSGKDPLKLPAEDFTELTNLEEGDLLEEVRARRGLKKYVVSPDQLNTASECDVYGHDFGTFDIPDSTDNDDYAGTIEFQTHNALVKDESLPAGVAAEKHRGRFIFGQSGIAHTWKELTTYAGLALVEFISDTVDLGSGAGVPITANAGASTRIPTDGTKTATGDSIIISGCTGDGVPYNATWTVESVAGSYIQIAKAFVDYGPGYAFEATSVLKYISTTIYGTKLGNANTLGGFAVQGWPIDAMKIGYNALSLECISEGVDKFGTHLQFGLGGRGPSNYPLMLQFINKPYKLADFGRNLGYFDDNFGNDGGNAAVTFQGWQFTKAAPSPEELAKNFAISLQTKSIAEADVMPLLPPGTYHYAVSLILDGVNRTESFWQGSINIDNDDSGTDSLIAPLLTILTRSNVASNADVPLAASGQYRWDSDGVGGWDAFLKRITAVVVHRRFEKGYWQPHHVGDVGRVGALTFYPSDEGDGEVEVIVGSIQDDDLKAIPLQSRVIFQGTDTNLGSGPSIDGSHTVLGTDPDAARQTGGANSITIKGEKVVMNAVTTNGCLYEQGAGWRINNRYVAFPSHDWRELAVIDINATQNLFGTSTEEEFEPNPATYTVWSGAVEVVSDTTVKLVNVTENDLLPDYMFNQGKMFVDYDDDGAAINLHYEIDANGLQGLTLTVATLAGISVAVGDILQVRIGSAWERSAAIVAGGVTYFEVFDIKVLDHRYEWAAGETTFIKGGLARRPNWTHRVLLADQAFVWDIWEDRRGDSTMRHWGRRLRYTVPSDVGYPTVFYDGVLDFPGDEDEDPIQSVVQVEVSIQSDITRVVALVLFKKTAQLMFIENGVPTAQPTIYQYGLASPKAVMVIGNQVFGITEGGLFWRFTKANMFEPSGISVRPDFAAAITAGDLERASMAPDLLINQLRVVWLEIARKDTDLSLTMPDWISKAALAAEFSTDEYADRNDYVKSRATNPLFQTWLTMDADITAARNFGFRWSWMRGLFFKRTSYADSADRDNFQLIQGAVEQDGSVVWAGKYRPSDVGGFFTLKTVDQFWDTTPATVKVGYNLDVQTKDFNELVQGLSMSIGKKLKEFSLLLTGHAVVHTVTVTSEPGNETDSFTFTPSGSEQVIRKWWRFGFQNIKVKIHAQTGATQTTPTIFRLLELVFRYLGARR